MLIDDRIRLYRLPFFRNQFDRAAKRASKIFHDDPGAIESALNGWAALNKADDTILPQIMEKSEVVHFPKGYRFIKYMGDGDDAFILLKGNALVKTPDGKLIPREAVTTIGEKRAIDRHSHRTAHVYAKTEIVALKMSGEDFRSLRDQCRIFEQNIDKDMRKRHTQAGLPRNKLSQWYITTAALCLAIAFGLLATNQTGDLLIGMIVALVIFAFALFVMKKFVVRAAFAVAASLLFAFQFQAKHGSSEESIFEAIMGQPSDLAIISAVLITITALVLDSLTP